MTLLFYDLPAEIILEVVNFLELPDPISLLLTCSPFYSLSNQRSFWISVLETTRKKSPIACPLYADLSQHSLEILKDLVFSWLKLQDNWNQSIPKIIRPVTSTRLQGPAEIIFNVQGTDILVLNMGGSVFCWDAKLGAPFPFPAIETGGRMTGVSAPTETRGVCAFAFFTGRIVPPYTTHRYVVTIKHEHGKAISFTSEFSEVLTPEGPRWESLFITEDVVGSVVALEAQDICIISLGAISSHSRLLDSTSPVKLHRIASGTTELILCFTYKGHLYNLLEDGLSVQIQHISRRSLRSGHCEESAVYNSDIVLPIGISGNEFRPFCFMIPTTPIYGVSAVFVRLKWDDEDDASSRISFTFLPTTLTHSSDDDEVASPLAFDAPCVTEFVPGMLLSLGLVWMDHSGFNVTVVLQAPAPRLVLVRFHPELETKRTSVHTLDVPDTIDLMNLNAVCVDDTAGAVHLIDRQGLFSTLRYV
ncbi:hypothetical protein B0H19DRAFT_1055880 [Mycena capillaripes]|nr:hypothetical protein B0H19DRAFT_1055880 [Mycena capillaripes]